MGESYVTQIADAVKRHTTRGNLPHSGCKPTVVRKENVKFENIVCLFCDLYASGIKEACSTLIEVDKVEKARRRTC